MNRSQLQRSIAGPAVFSFVCFAVLGFDLVSRTIPDEHVLHKIVQRLAFNDKTILSGHGSLLLSLAIVAAWAGYFVSTKIYRQDEASRSRELNRK